MFSIDGMGPNKSAAITLSIRKVLQNVDVGV